MIAPSNIAAKVAKEARDLIVAQDAVQEAQRALKARVADLFPVKEGQVVRHRYTGHRYRVTSVNAYAEHWGPNRGTISISFTGRRNYGTDRPDAYKDTYGLNPEDYLPLDDANV